MTSRPLARIVEHLVLGPLPRSADDPLGPVAQDPDDARDVACDLTAPDDVCSPPTPEPRDLEPPDVSTGTSTGGGFGTLLVVLLVAALVAFLVWLVLALLRQRRAGDEDEVDEELDEDLDEPVERRVVDHERPPDTWRSAAEEHRHAGRYRQAIRCEYRALVGDLARAGIVDEIPGRTSGEERVQLAELAPQVAPDFDAAADIFDEAWFSDHEVGSDHDQRFLAAERVVLDAVLTGATPRRRSER